MDGTPLWDGYSSDRDHYLRQTYGLKLPHWEAILDEQGGRCPVCERPFTARRQPVVDENHDDGEIRGGPCDPCNRKLDERMVAYLLDPPARRVARRFGVDRFVVPLSRQEAMARRRRLRQAKRVGKQPSTAPPPTDDYDAKTRRALRQTATKQGA